MYHWKGTDPGDPSAPQLTMYWGRLGSRPWYRISAGTCSTSSSPWHQERPENLIPGAATSTMECEPKGRTPPPRAGHPQLLPRPSLPQKTPFPANQTPQPCQKAWQDQVSPTPSPGSPSNPTLTPERGERRYSSSMCTCTSAMDVYLCCRGTGQGHHGPPVLSPAPACSHHPVPSLLHPCPRGDLCRCAGWELLGPGVGEDQ